MIKLYSPILFIYLALFLGGMMKSVMAQEKIFVKIRVLEAETNEVTPVMVCITGAEDGKVRLPPLAIVSDSVSLTRDFYQGIAFDDDKNWIGPVRKMNGIGNNDDRSYVYGSLPSIPYWNDPVVYQTSGDFSITLSPGKWRISLAHGNEYIPITEEFDLSANETEITKTFHLKRWIDLPKMGWYSGDVHVHHPTIKPAFKKFLLKYAQAEDIHLVNILEMGHHQGTEFNQEGFGEEFRTYEDDICLVSGQEGPRSTFGHIIGLNINKMEHDTSSYNYYDIVFKKLHLQPGAIVGYAHFSWNGCNLPRGFPWYLTTGHIDFVELLQFSKINTPDYYDYLNLGFRITAAAGSDVPWGSTMGEVRTFVYSGDTFSADSWFEGLKAGRTFVSNGPVVFLEADGLLPGTEIIKDKGAISRIKVKALSHPSIGRLEGLVIYNNEGLVKGKMNPDNSDSITIEIAHKLEKSQWLAAMVTCENGAVAHTTPVYFIIDGKPTWDAKKAPEIIDKQFEAIRKIEEETKNKETVDQGILDRLQMARDFYHGILMETGND